MKNRINTLLYIFGGMALITISLTLYFFFKDFEVVPRVFIYIFSNIFPILGLIGTSIGKINKSKKEREEEIKEIRKLLKEEDVEFAHFMGKFCAGIKLLKDNREKSEEFLNEMVNDIDKITKISNEKEEKIINRLEKSK